MHSNKLKAAAVFVCFTIVFCVGVSVAYVNTRAYGFDSNARLVSHDGEKITVFDFDIYYDDLENLLERAGELIPDEQYAV